MTKIEEIEQKLREMDDEFKHGYNELLKALAELKESKKENSGKWKPAQDDEYWYRVSTNGAIVHDYYDENSMAQLWRINHNLVFKAKEECERYCRFMDTVKEKSYEFSREQWEDWDITKYYISYDYEEKEIEVCSVAYTRSLGDILFKTRDDAQYIIDNFKDELIEYWI